MHVVTKVTKEEIINLQKRKGLANDCEVRSAINKFAVQNPPEELLNLFEELEYCTKRTRAPQIAYLLSKIATRETLKRFYDLCFREFGEGFDGDRQLMSCLKADHFAVRYHHCRATGVCDITI